MRIHLREKREVQERMTFSTPITLNLLNYRGTTYNKLLIQSTGETETIMINEDTRSSHSNPNPNTTKS